MHMEKVKFYQACLENVDIWSIFLMFTSISECISVAYKGAIGQDAWNDDKKF